MKNFQIESWDITNGDYVSSECDYRKKIERIRKREKLVSSAFAFTGVALAIMLLILTLIISTKIYM